MEQHHETPGGTLTIRGGPPPAITVDRRSYIGGSDIGAILGVDQYRTPLDVWREKRGLVLPFEGNAHTKRGTKLEDIAAQEYTAQTGRKLRRRNASLIHPIHDYLRGHKDRDVVGMARTVEIKCPSLGAFKKIEREGLPESYIAQLNWYLGLDEQPEGEWVLFCADQWQTLIFPVQFDDALFSMQVKAAVKFWTEHVLTGAEPEPAKTDDERAKIERTGGTVTRVETPEFVEAAALLREAKLLSKEAETLEAMAKDRLKELVKEKGGYEGGGVRFYWTMEDGRESWSAARVMENALSKKRVVETLKGAKVEEGVIELVQSVAAVRTADIPLYKNVGKGFEKFTPYLLGRPE